MEKQRWHSKHPDYQLIASSRKRMRAYSPDEIAILKRMKQSGNIDQQIADALGRTYWSVVYKASELRSQNLL